MLNTTLNTELVQRNMEKSQDEPKLLSNGSRIPIISGIRAKEGAEAPENTKSVSASNTGNPLGRTVTAQDWTGPDDPENPMNWALLKKVYHTVIPGLFAFIVTFGSSVYTPGYPEVMARFQISSVVALLGLSLYVLGLAFGPVLAAPISETYGRRVVYLVSLPMAALFTLGAGFSESFASLVICRFFAGFFGSPVLAVGVSLSDQNPIPTTPLS